MSIILQKFVDEGLFSLRSDEDFSKLKEAANNLSKSVLKKKENLPPYILAAFDPNVDASDPTLERTKELVIKQSPTVLSQSKDTPRTILRAVVLESLYTRALNDPEYARIIWLTVSSVMYNYVTDQEKNLLIPIIQELGEMVEKQAVHLWSLVNEVSPEEVEGIQISIDGLKGLKSDIDNFKSEFHNAFQNTSWGGQNPYSHPQHNQNWGNYFTDNGSNSIVRFVENAIKKSNSNLDQVAKQINEYILSLQPYFEKIGEQALSGVSAVNNRSELLWWKESLYSRTRNASYRSLDKNHLPVFMAYDLFLMVNQVYPLSIDYFLKETLARLIPFDQKPIKLVEFIKLFKSDELKDLLVAANFKFNSSPGKSTLLNFLGLVATQVETEADMAKKLGIKPDTEFSQHELSVWLFHDLQAYKTIMS